MKKEQVKLFKQHRKYYENKINRASRIYGIVTKDIKFVLSEYRKEKRNSIGLKNIFEEIMAKIWGKAQNQRFKNLTP